MATAAQVNTDNLDPRRGPDGWELSLGTVAERTARIGRSSLEFRAKTNQGDGRGDRQGGEWRAVRDLGQGAMKLVMGGSDSLDPFVAGANGGGGGASDEVEDAEDADEAWSDDSDVDEGDAAAADINAILDADYDTSTWSVHEIESACNTLLVECETTSVVRRRVLATRMLLRLMDRHHEAQKYVEVAFETVVNRGVPTMAYGISDKTFHVAHLLAAVGSRLADKLSTLNIVPRVVKMLAREGDLAAKVLQNRIRLRSSKRKERELQAEGVLQPLDVRVRQRLMQDLKTEDLNNRFRALREDPSGGRLPPDVLVSYLQTLREVTASTHEKYAELNRVQLVKSGGMVTLVGCLKEGGEVCELARATLLNIAQEPALLESVLAAQCVPALIRDFHADGDVGTICSSLEVLDALASNAVLLVGLPEIGGKDATHVLRLAGVPNPTGWPEGLNTPPKTDDETLRYAVRRFFISSRVVQVVLELLHSEDAEMFLGATVVAHKMACTLYYHQVLAETVANAGVVLVRVVDALASNQDTLPVAVATFLAQLCTRQEGRDALITTGIVEMLRPLVVPARDADSQEFVLGMSIFATLAESESLPPIPPNRENMSTSKDRLRDRLYQNMMATLTRAAPTPAFFVKRLVAMGCMSCALRFLVRPETPIHVFDLPKHQRYMGSIILHRMACQTEVRGADIIFHEAVLLYAAFLVQHNAGEMAEGALGRISSDRVALFYISTQACCLVMSELADAQEPPDARAQVLAKLKRTTALHEVVELLMYPEAKYDPLYRHKMECVIAATMLLQSIAPRPEADVLPESEHELGRSEIESAAECIPMLEDLIEYAAKALVRIIQCCENRTAVSAACLALARLAATNQSCAKLLERNITKVAATLIPSRPTIKHDMASAEKDELMRGDAHQMTRLPPSFFRLATSLARLPDGQNSIQAAGVVKRAVERMTMGDWTPHDLAVKTEIALLFARMANKYSVEFGSTTELILKPKFRVLATLLKMLKTGHTRRTRFSAANALHSLCSDVTRGIPAFVANNGVPSMLAVVREKQVVHPLLREALETIKLVADYPGGAQVKGLLDNGAQAALQHIASDLTLEEPYTDVLDRYGLSDVARDCLIALDEYGTGKVKMSDANDYTTESARVTKHQVDAGLGLGENGEPEAAFDGTYLTVGVSQYGSLVPDEDYSSKVDQTPVGLLSAREQAFRYELRKRKTYYELDRVEVPEDADEEVRANSAGNSDAVVGGAQYNHHHDKITQLPVMAMDEYPDTDRTIASLQENPHLARTRPPRKPKAVEVGVIAVESEDALVPLVMQRRHQSVQPAMALAPGDDLMLDPCFGRATVTTPVQQSNTGNEKIRIKQVGAYTFGAEQFKHSCSVFGHHVDVTTHRVVTGRMSESGVHTSTFKNIEESVASMMASRARAGPEAQARM